jgi:two-component system response regulator QseB
MRILLAEDDALIGTPLQEALRAAGHAVDWVRDGGQADAALRTEPYDCAVLDLGLPTMDGLDVLRALRRRGHATPVLVLTARDATSDRVQGLDAGADDYLVKPFSVDELQARLRALVRRSTGVARPVLQHGDVTLDPATREVRSAGRPVALSAREYAVLEALLQRPSAVWSRAQLEERLYGWGEEPESNAVEVYVHGLRRKLGAEFVRTVRGLGYTLQRA